MSVSQTGACQCHKQWAKQIIGDMVFTHSLLSLWTGSKYTCSSLDWNDEAFLTTKDSSPIPTGSSYRSRIWLEPGTDTHVCHVLGAGAGDVVVGGSATEGGGGYPRGAGRSEWSLRMFTNLVVAFRGLGGGSTSGEYGTWRHSTKLANNMKLSTDKSTGTAKWLWEFLIAIPISSTLMLH